MWFHTEFNQCLTDAERDSAGTSPFWYFGLKPSQFRLDPQALSLRVYTHTHVPSTITQKYSVL